MAGLKMTHVTVSRLTFSGRGSLPWTIVLTSMIALLNYLVHWLLVNEIPCASCSDKGIYQV